jgi:hypothetical protein
MLLVITKKIIFSAVISMASIMASTHSRASELSIPDELHSFMPTQQVISGIYAADDYILVFPSKQPYMIRVPFKSDAIKRSEKFGRLDEQVRIPLNSGMAPGDWRGLYADGDMQIVWDANILQLLILRKKDFSPVRVSTPPIDLLKPAPDRGGEPTKTETSRTRSAFHKSFVKISESRFTGMVEIPESWGKDKGRNFLLASRIKGFPLLMMTCAKDDAATCVMTRTCTLNGGFPSKNGYGIGLGIDAERREVLMANSMTNRIDIFHFNSCADVRHVSSLSLPPKMPKISGLNIDDRGRLWVTTGVMDSSFDTNVFYWEKTQWRDSGGLKKHP